MGIPALKAHRQAAGISQSEIAKEFGVATRTVQRWEGAGDEDTTPDLGVLLLLKEKYRCKTIDELLSPPAPRQRRRSRGAGSGGIAAIGALGALAGFLERAGEALRGSALARMAADVAGGQIDSAETQNLIAEVEMLIPAIAPLFDLIQQAAPVIQAMVGG